MTLALSSRVKYRYAFLRDVDAVQISSIGEATNDGLRVSKQQEHTVHEYAHAASLGLRLARHHRGPSLSSAIELRLNRLSKKQQKEDEYRTLAAELILFRSFDLVDDEEEFLEAIADLQTDMGLVDSVLRGTRYAHYGAVDVARSTLRRIREAARTRRREAAEEVLRKE